MQVLFCSPFLQTPDVVTGGINQWGRYIVSYYNQYGEEDIELIPVSFDRHLYLSGGDVLIWKRILSGIKEQGSAVKEAKKAIKRVRPDVVHVCTSAGLGLIKDLFLINAAHKAGAKTVVHFHFGRIPELMKKQNWECKLIKKVLCTCDIPVVMNMPSFDALLSLGYSRTRYLPNPLSQDVINAIKEQACNTSRVPNRLLYVGHVARTKGIYEMVEACSRLGEASLRIVGKYSEQDKVELLGIASEAGNGLAVEFIGEVPHSQVIKEFLEAEIFVFPSYSEGFPNVILEAMACGCPIAASDVGAIPEMLDVDGESCGICYQPRSADAVYDAVSLLLADENLRKTYSSRAQKRVNELYAMPVVWEQLTKIWRVSLMKEIVR